jgi:hypothetical protein
MCAGARATGSRARSGLRGDRDAVSLRGKTPRADPLGGRDFPPSHVAPRPSSFRPEHDPVSGLFNGLQGGKVSLQLPPESRKASRAPVYQILWVRVFRDHTIPGANSIFSSLCGAISGRTPFCRQVLSRRDPDDRNASVQKIDDRLGGLLRDGGAGTNIERPRDFGKKFLERLGSCATFRSDTCVFRRIVRGNLCDSNGL